MSVVASSPTDELLTSANSGSISASYGFNTTSITAPGYALLAPTPYSGLRDTSVDSDYAYATTASSTMAASVVAGAAALVWGQNTEMTACQVKTVLMNTADINDNLVGKTRANVRRAGGGGGGSVERQG